MRHISTKKRKADFLEAVKKSLGINIAAACRTAKVSRATFYRWITEDPDFKTDFEEISEEAIDFVESELMKRVQKNDITAIIFYLKTKGKKRGYVEQHDVAVATPEKFRRFTLNVLPDSQDD